MNTVAGETILKQLHWRYATKKFDPTRTITEADWKVLEQSLVLSPSSYGLQPWKFFVITDQATKDKLPPFTWNQNQVKDASHVVVMAIRKNLGLSDIERHLHRTAEVRGVPVENLEGFKKMMVGSLVPPKGFDINAWATHQVYIALGSFMTVAAMLGIDTCPMEGFLPEKYDDLLGLPQLGYSAVVLCPAGYRHVEDKAAVAAKVRFKTEEVVQPKAI